jgi:hypothetical protein
MRIFLNVYLGENNGLLVDIFFLLSTKLLQHIQKSDVFYLVEVFSLSCDLTKNSMVFVTVEAQFDQRSF